MFKESLIEMEEGRAAPLAGPPEPRFTRREDGALLYRSPEGPAVSVHLKACFPWSEPERFISVRNSRDEELMLIESPNDLDSVSAAVIREELARTEFVFAVTGIDSVKEEFELRVWQIRTRQGARQFQTELDSWPQRLPGGGYLLRDVCGDSYRFPPPSELDEASSKRLWPFVD